MRKFTFDIHLIECKLFNNSRNSNLINTDSVNL